MTIDLLEVNLSSVFEFGQVYVALSRGTALSRCRVIGFDAQKVKAHPRVLEFYRNLSIGQHPDGGAGIGPSAAVSARTAMPQAVAFNTPQARGPSAPPVVAAHTVMPGGAGTGPTAHTEMLRGPSAAASGPRAPLAVPAHTAMPRAVAFNTPHAHTEMPRGPSAAACKPPLTQPIECDLTASADGGRAAQLIGAGGPRIGASHTVGIQIAMNPTQAPRLLGLHIPHTNPVSAASVVPVRTNCDAESSALRVPDPICAGQVAQVSNADCLELDSEY
jgi:hypothetical protein